PSAFTMTATDGSTTTTTTAKDGSATTTEKAADGSTGTVKTDAQGNSVSAEAAPSAEAISNAAEKGEAVTLPVEVKATNDAASAAEVKVTLPETVSAENPATVEIPVENLTPGTVAVIVNADGTEEIVKTSTTGENGVVLTLDGSTTVKIVDNTKSFNDVNGSEWYAGNVAWAASREVMNGVGNGDFAPDADTTQGMMEQILYNLDGNALVAPAEGEAWWSAADGWAAEIAVTDGVAAHDPSAPATREQDIVMMYNYAKVKGYDTSARADLATFSDADGVSDWAREAMEWAVAVGIINGTTDGNGNVILNAQGVATRAQIAAITERFCEKVAK
ncbi:MAG: S-layer homology domain-containing protein, partial [Oscillospiraceae bacterium]|nr:S-layer homology domain-containing protein [Oscillospiraceae bacterium]